jgi:hypothetical protein
MSLLSFCQKRADMNAEDKVDPTTGHLFQKVIRHFVTTPHKAREPLKKAAARKRYCETDVPERLVMRGDTDPATPARSAKV